MGEGDICKFSFGLRLPLTLKFSFELIHLIDFTTFSTQTIQNTTPWRDVGHRLEFC